MNSFTSQFEVILGERDPQAVAFGRLELDVEGEGWAYLEIEATPQDETVEKYLQSMRAMGYLEGYSTWKQIEQYYPNYYQGMFDTDNPEPVDPDIRVQQYLLDNFKWMSEKSKSKYLESAHWLTVRGIVEQLEGLLQGFIDGRLKDQEVHGFYDDDTSIYHSDKEDAGPANDDFNLNSNSQDHTHLTTLKNPILLHFLILNGNGDLIQITEKIAALDNAVKKAELNDELKRQNQTFSSKVSKNRKLSYSVNPEDITPLSLMKSSRSGDHCSAFIKVLPDKSDVVFAHNTWDDYRSMGPRIFKHYIFPPWPVELKQEERKKDTFLSYTEQPLHQSEDKKDMKKSKKGKDENKGKEKEKEEEDKDKEEIEDHCLCPATQYSKPIHSKSDNSKKIYQFAPHSYFSSSPGILTSVDDFYTTYTSPNLHIEENRNKNCYCEGPGGRMGIMETSLDVKSPELYNLIVPESLLSWIRVRSANLIATDGKDWVSRFSHDHSGTYANQWMVIDFTKFNLEEDLKSNGETDGKNDKKEEEKLLSDGFLTIVEEMPGMIQSGDETNHLLSRGYWASYNEPFYSDLSDYSGNTNYCQSTREDYAANHDPTNAYGLWPGEVNCYETCSRARLFQRLQSTVKDIHDAMSLITYNNYQHDTESFGDSCESISCREDLEDSLYNIRAFGAIDAKVSSILRADIYRDLPTSMSSFASPVSHVSVASFHHIYPREPQFIIHQGPTNSNQQPFCWNAFETKQNNFYDTLRNTLLNTGKNVENQVRDGHGDHNDEVGSEEDKLRGLRASSHDRMGKNHLKHSLKTKRSKRPSIQYNHYGQPNCFAYDWVIVPPASRTG